MTPTTTFPPGGPLRLIPWEPALADVLRASRIEGPEVHEMREELPELAAPRYPNSIAFASTPSAERVRKWVRERFGRELTRIEWPT